MRKIFHTNFAETDFFFGEHMELLAAWNNNDASYRREYMERLFNELDVEVNEIKPSEAKMPIKEYFEVMGTWEEISSWEQI